MVEQETRVRPADEAFIAYRDAQFEHKRLTDELAEQMPDSLTFRIGIDYRVQTAESEIAVLQAEIAWLRAVAAELEEQR